MCRLDELKGRLDEVQREVEELQTDFDLLKASVRAPVLLLTPQQE